MIVITRSIWEGRKSRTESDSGFHRAVATAENQQNNS